MPTFERPMNAYSGIGSFGHLATLVLLITNSADLIFKMIYVLMYEFPKIKTRFLILYSATGKKVGLMNLTTRQKHLELSLL